MHFRDWWIGKQVNPSADEDNGGKGDPGSEKEADEKTEERGRECIWFMGFATAGGAVP
jgi:hypothetical protein